MQQELVSRLFHSHKMHLLTAPLLGLFTKRNDVFLTVSDTSTREIPTLAYTRSLKNIRRLKSDNIRNQTSNNRCLTSEIRHLISNIRRLITDL